MQRVGIDILEIDRIKLAIEKNIRFKEKIYTEYEKKYIENKNEYSCPAGIFAAKEAISKMIGTGISGFSWKDIEICHNKNGKPIINLRNAAKEVANAQGFSDMDISISHNRDTVIAISTGSLENPRASESKHPISISRRKKDTHKGDYGRIALIGGSRGMCGSIYLSSISSLRTGSGIVYTVVPDSISDIMQIKSTENIVKSITDDRKGYLCHISSKDKEDLGALDAIGIGPGMGRDEETYSFLEELIESTENPMVIDADGIFHLRGYREKLRSKARELIITPHMGEFSNFTGIDIDRLKAKPVEYSKEIALKYGIVVVLKGNKTVVTDGKETYINSSGNPGMATAGSGDVLTGIITSLLGQGFGVFESAKLGVYIHGLAGDIAREDMGEYGLIASDIAKAVAKAIKRIEI